MSKNILITGTNGFIGRNLKEGLTNSHALYCPLRSELDLLNPREVKNYLDRHKIEVVVHCASSGVKRDAQQQQNVVEDNLKMFFNLVKNLKSDQKLINLGSGAEYDKELDISGIREEDFGRSIPTLSYDFSKYLMSRYIEKSSELISHLRFFCVFGKYEDYERRFISRSICRSLFNLPIEINQNAFFDYLNVEDGVKIIDYFIENSPQEKVYNVGSGTKVDLLTIAEKIRKISKKDIAIIVKNSGLGKEYTCNNSRLLNELGNFQFTGLDEAIQKLYDYYQSEFFSLDQRKVL